MYKKVYIEITNICNLNCDFCVKNARVSKYMTLEEFKLILNKLQGYTQYLYFHILGEPLMHPKINEFIDLASKNFFVNMTTNGYLINKIKDNENIRQINISLHSYNERYHKTLEEYLNNILKTVENLKKNTYISYRLWAKTKYKEEIITYLEEYYHKSINGNCKLSKNVFIEFEKEFIWPSLEQDIISENGRCYALKDHLGILVDGTIVPCCLDSKGDINLGNIFNDDLKSIVNLKRYQDILNGFKESKKCEELCKRCNFIK